MATHSSSTMPGRISDDAQFRTASQFVHDVFALGWVQTADSGQINLTTATRPATNNKGGYEVWRMDDTLQGTAPVVLRIDYGQGNTSNSFAVWLTIGTGSNGSGTITGAMLSDRLITTNSVEGNDNPYNHFGSAANNRITLAFGMKPTSGGTGPWWFAIERTKVPGTTTGQDSGDGVIVMFGAPAEGGAFHNIYNFGAIPPPTWESGLQVVLSTKNPSQMSGDQGIGLAVPILGYARQPGLNVCVTLSLDFSDYATPSFPIYGSTHTYQHCGMNITNLARGRTDNTTRLLLRYE